MSACRPPGAAGPFPGPVLRGGVLAGATAVLTVLGHLAGGGALPDLALLVVLCPLLALAIIALAERARGLLGTLLVLAGGQAVMHTLMVLLGHDHRAGTATAMLATHALATLASAVLLHEVDSLLTGLAKVLRRLLPRRVPAPPALRPLPALACAPAGVIVHIRRAAVAALVRRGPPVPGAS